MFHLAAFAGAKTDSTANEVVPAVTDGAWSVSSNNRYISPGKYEVFASQAINDTITRARINAPSLRGVGLPDIQPLTVTAGQNANPVIDYHEYCRPVIQATEEFGVDASNGASTVDFCYAGLWMRQSMERPPVGREYSVVGTSTITLVAQKWAAGTIALEQTLPYGWYVVAGMNVVCTNGVFARLFFQGNNTERPGVPCVATVGGFDYRQIFRHGRSGVFGKFNSTAQPTIEIMGTTAGAQTATIWLDIVPLTPEMGMVA